MHDDVIKWKFFPRYWPLCWKLSFDVSLTSVWINGWENNREAGDLSRHHAHYDLTVTDLFKIDIPWRMHVIFTATCLVWVKLVDDFKNGTVIRLNILSRLTECNSSNTRNVSRAYIYHCTHWSWGQVLTRSWMVGINRLPWSWHICLSDGIQVE